MLVSGENAVASLQLNQDITEHDSKSPQRAINSNLVLSKHESNIRTLGLSSDPNSQRAQFSGTNVVIPLEVQETNIDL